MEPQKMFRLFILTACVPLLASAQVEPPPDEDSKEAVSNVVRTFGTGNIEAIGALMEYPIDVGYPIKTIDNVNEFRVRWTEVFDTKLINEIATSNPQEDWEKVGWRGIMFGNGKIWLGDDGRISSVIHETDLYRLKYKETLSLERSTLHESIRAYERPMLKWETTNYRVRIDKLSSGEFRYASWSKNSPLLDKPELILSGGELKPDGSGGNHRITFKSGEYDYIAWVFVLTNEEDEIGSLEVRKNDETVLEEPVLRSY